MRSSVVVVVIALAACSESKPAEPAEKPSRFAAVKKDANASTSKAAKAFCDVQFPAGENGKKLGAFPERPVAGQPTSGTPGAWKWVNLWATWCTPCIEEMGLLAKWRDSLKKDGVNLDIDLWSVDDDEPALTSYIKKNNMPGRVRWLRSSNDLDAALEMMGAQKGSAIPVHAFVDANDNVRCVRMGSVHDEDYAAIKSILTGA